jgi:hypothetical protein
VDENPRSQPVHPRRRRIAETEVEDDDEYGYDIHPRLIAYNPDEIGQTEPYRSKRINGVKYSMGGLFRKSSHGSSSGSPVHFEDEDGLPSYHSSAGYIPSHHSMGAGNPFEQDPSDQRLLIFHHSMGGFNPFEQDPPFGGDTPFHHNASSSFVNVSFPSNNFDAPTAPQFRSNSHSSSILRGHAPLSAPRPGKIRKGDPLPTGIFDPLATSAAAVLKGHHGLREHRPGMTNMHVGRGTSADNSAAKWELMSEPMRTEREGGTVRGGGSRYTHSAR